MNEQNEHAYAIRIGKTTFYHHEDCWLAARVWNPNDLTPEEMADTEEAYSRVPIKAIPVGICCLTCAIDMHENGLYGPDGRRRR